MSLSNLDNPLNNLKADLLEELESISEVLTDENIDLEETLTNGENQQVSPQDTALITEDTSEDNSKQATQDTQKHTNATTPSTQQNITAEQAWSLLNRGKFISSSVGAYALSNHLNKQK